MYQKKIPIRKECGLHIFKELLNGKWKLMLIYYISEDIKRPGALQKTIAADRRVMTKQLNELVLHGFVEKISFDTKIPKVEYRLTPLGNSLLPLIISIEQWGENNRAVLEGVPGEKQQ
ncbi:helix-turn-helix domain-containing protein [Pedobacter sp. BMA]|uniref:winged helix-turn-helix transcriptional regulator n=1 Tax=Pedobacter sp. BMA TaxID=1663685 RepID=UPI000649ED3A|nr:helix-turn-helix domain-containing protein [Pedobacter sp. BMA]KLT64768.1 HxlR family transcriptional regulator [Pedobacter sp. BMA]